MSQTATIVGPADNGRRMSLDEFDRVEVRPGFLYELARGVIVVSDIPGLPHMAQVDELRQALAVYRAQHPNQIRRILTGSECKLLLGDQESERHPDIAVYKTAPPDAENVWAVWVPALVIEVVSPGSEQRDYIEKREEYLAFGVREYWIVDAARGEVMVLRRVGRRWTERVVRAPAEYQTKVLPGFTLPCETVFQAAGEAGA
jgi:Uma2 family endonuclease